MPTPHEVDQEVLLAAIVDRDGPLPMPHFLRPHVQAHFRAMEAASASEAARHLAARHAAAEAHVASMGQPDAPKPQRRPPNT